MFVTNPWFYDYEAFHSSARTKTTSFSLDPLTCTVPRHLHQAYTTDTQACNNKNSQTSIHFWHSLSSTLKYTRELIWKRLWIIAKRVAGRVTKELAWSFRLSSFCKCKIMCNLVFKQLYLTFETCFLKFDKYVKNISFIYQSTFSSTSSPSSDSGRRQLDPDEIVIEPQSINRS